MNFNFGEVLTQAGRIIWKHKALWAFGILAGCAQSRTSANFSGGSSGGSSGADNGGAFNPNSPAFQRGVEEAMRWMGQNWWIILAAAIVLVVVSILFYLVGVIGRIGLIKGTYKADNDAETMSFGELWSESTPYMWRVFLLSFLVGLAFVVIFLLALLPGLALGAATAGVGLLLFIPLLCILIPVSWIVSILIEQANIAIVLEDLGIWEGVKRGWEVCRVNWGPLLVMALILLIGGSIVGFVIALPILAAVLPLAIGAVNQSQTALIIGGLCFAAYLLPLIFLGGLLNAYIQSAWTLTYMRLTRPQGNAPVFVEGNAQ